MGAGASAGGASPSRLDSSKNEARTNIGSSISLPGFGSSDGPRAGKFSHANLKQDLEKWALQIPIAKVIILYFAIILLV